MRRGTKSGKRRSRRSMGNILTTRNFTMRNVTGAKKHTKTRIERHINPSGHVVKVSNSYMNKKGIVRHSRTKTIYPYAAPALSNMD
jgi:hypothetical protein